MVFVSPQERWMFGSRLFVINVSVRFMFLLYFSVQICGGGHPINADLISDTVKHDSDEFKSGFYESVQFQYEGSEPGVVLCVLSFECRFR